MDLWIAAILNDYLISKFIQAHLKKKKKKRISLSEGPAITVDIFSFSESVAYFKFALQRWRECES